MKLQSSSATSNANGYRHLGLRNRHIFLLDLLILSMTPLASLLLRVDGAQTLSVYFKSLVGYIIFALILRLILYYLLGLYSRYWRYASIDEMIQILVAAVVSTLVIAIVFFAARSLFPTFNLPRSIPFIDGLLALAEASAIRFIIRASRRQHVPPRSDARRVLVIGAGDAGAMIVRELRNNPRLGIHAVGFIDDDLAKHDVRIHNVPVLGNRHAIPAVVRKLNVDQAIIAMPTAPGKAIREIVAICEAADVSTKIIPGIYELLDGTVSVNQLRDVDIEDLLRRAPIETDTAAVAQLLEGKCVLVTGGGGSIGSELCRQALRCHPEHLVLLGHGENSIFEIYHELKRQAPAMTAVTPVIADIRFPKRIEAIFKQHRPQVVFHAAAHKHVPLMEANPAEAITNNVLGTLHLLNAARASGVEQFVMLSTDKAVNPNNIMGASKRVAELLVHRTAVANRVPFVAVRFGNVLGSRGSVVLTFKKQIRAGGPVTVTHPEMKRYFMTIPEAVQLVLQAAVLGEGGEVFVLDMGEPVKIVDLARDLIELSGLEVGRDVEIKFTGPRPGDKMFEELFLDGEVYRRTRHEKIVIAHNASSFAPPDFEEYIEALAAAAERSDDEAIRQILHALVPAYKPARAAPEQQPAREQRPFIEGKLAVDSGH